MSVTSLVPQQPAPQPQAQTPAAALQLVKASLEALAAKLGQTLAATVLGTDANGLTQVRIGAETLTLKLSLPLPPGMQISVQVQPSPSGTPTVVIQPTLAPVAAQQAPVVVTPAAPVTAGMPGNVPVGAPAPASATGPVPTGGQAGAPVPTASPAQTAATAPAQQAQLALSSAVPTAASAQPTAPAGALPASAVSPALIPVSPTPAAPAGPPVPNGTPVQQSGSTPQSAPAHSAAATPQSTGVAAQPAVATAAAAIATTPAPAPVQTATAPAPATGISAASATAPAGQPATAASAQIAAMPTVTAPSGSSTPATTVVAAAPTTPAPASATPSPAAAPQAAPATGPVPSAPGPSATSATHMPVSPSSAATLSAPPATPAQGPVLTAAPAGASATPQPNQATAPPAAAASPAAAAAPTLPLAQPAQAAARQDSIAPLLHNLAALQGKLASFPQPVVEAALRLLAARIPLDRGAPGAETLKQAVMRAGVLATPAASNSAQPADIKAALLQLRAGLLGFLEGGAIAPVAPIARRPPPPLRDAQPRGYRADAPTLPDNATAREAGRTLLHQTDAALSRLKLTQLASQPPDARTGAVSVRDLIVELPMMLGHELAIAQLQVQRDGKQKGKPGERGWRLRFAVSFSVIGEVGAQVALLGDTTNVVVWAGEPATADALETLLPELGPALAARGLKVGAVKLRRGAPETSRPDSGRLMDRTR